MTRIPDRETVSRAIANAENGTTGRIHVALLDDKRVEDPIGRARAIFSRLDHAGNAGVLILVAPRARRFAVIGDDAVHERAGDELWQSVTGAMGSHFANDDIEGGISHGLDLLGDALRRHHPDEGQS